MFTTFKNHCTNFAIIAVFSILLGACAGSVEGPHQFSADSKETKIEVPVKPVAPSISSISPASGSELGGTGVVIIGTGFGSDSVVKVGGSPCESTIFVDLTTLRCITPPHSVGAVEVIVINANSMSAVLKNAFMYEAAIKVEALANVLISRNAVDFGLVNVGSSVTESIRLFNNGNGPAMTGMSFDLSGTDFSMDRGCGGTLAPLQTCDVVLKFSPSLAVSRLGTVNIKYTRGNAPGSANEELTLAISLSGTGVAVPVPTPEASPSSSPVPSVPPTADLSFSAGFDYGDVTVGAASSPHVFTLSNSGGASTALSFSLPDGFIRSGGSGSCGSVLGANTSCKVYIEFVPALAIPYSGLISANYSNGSTPPPVATAAVIGVGRTPAVLAVTNINFPGVETNPDPIPSGYLTVSNSGESNASVLEKTVSALPFSFNGSGAYPGTGTCGSEIPAQSNCTIGIKFNPQAPNPPVAQSYSETLTLNYMDGVGAQSASGALTGNAVAPIIPAVLTLSPVSLTFPDANVDSVTELSVTVTHSGGTDAGAVGGSFDNAVFAFKGGSYPGGGTCQSVIAVGSAPCTIGITFSPNLPKLESGSLQLSYVPAGFAAKNANLTLSGTGLDAPAGTLSFVPSTVTFPETMHYGFSKVTATLKNSVALGGSTLTIKPQNAIFPTDVTFLGGSYPGTTETGVSGTCPLDGKLAPQATCTVELEFNPLTVDVNKRNTEPGKDSYFTYSDIVKFAYLPRASDSEVKADLTVECNEIVTLNTWTTTSVATGVPSARSSHTAVWTGDTGDVNTANRMIVWGGKSSASTYLASGGIYDPSTHSWKPTSITFSPLTSAQFARFGHTAIWTEDTQNLTSSHRMIVWGGQTNGNSYLNTGGIYDPKKNEWAFTDTGADAPSARTQHTAVWTGNTGSASTSNKMIIWGGSTAPGVHTNQGRIYDVATNTWTVMRTTNAPSARSKHTTVWTGSKMIVWGGCTSTCDTYTKYLGDGGVYDPSSDLWTPFSMSSGWVSGNGGYQETAQRIGHTAVWTGSEMLFYGGIGALSYFSTPSDNYPLTSGAGFNPQTKVWSMGIAVSHGGRGHTAIWTGSRMVVWGGGASLSGGGSYPYTGFSYDPFTRNTSWVYAFNYNATAVLVAGRYDHTAVWTGSQMIVWGGTVTGDTYTNTGGSYYPPNF